MEYSGLLEAAFRKLDLSVPGEHIEKLSAYCGEIERWNARINLTGLRGAELARLVSEPVWIGRQLGVTGALVDIGSGNGCPAIPLCVTRQLVEAHLVEVRLKRAVFLRHIQAELQLSGVSVHRARLEDIAEELGKLGKMDWITMQAVALSKPLMHCLHLLSSTTTRVVLITSGTLAPVPSATRMSIPGASTVAWVFSVNPS